MGWFAKLFGREQADSGDSEPAAPLVSVERPETTDITTEQLPKEKRQRKPRGNAKKKDDETVMIECLIRHLKTKQAVIKRLTDEGIPCEPTTGNDPQGDILVLVIRKKDIVRVQQIIRTLNA